MRTFIITILVWAVLIGFFVTGIRVMATAPSATPVKAVSENTGNVNDLQRIPVDRANVKLDH
jgi:hypothetical protein